MRSGATPKATVKEGLAEDSSKPHAEAVGVLQTNRSCWFYSPCSVACLCCSSDRNCKWCVSCDSSARSASLLVITMPKEAEVNLISSVWCAGIAVRSRVLVYA